MPIEMQFPPVTRHLITKTVIRIITPVQELLWIVRLERAVLSRGHLTTAASPRRDHKLQQIINHHEIFNSTTMGIVTECQKRIKKRLIWSIGISSSQPSRLYVHSSSPFQSTCNKKKREKRKIDISLDIGILYQKETHTTTKLRTPAANTSLILLKIKGYTNISLR